LHSQDIRSNPIRVETFDGRVWVSEVVFMFAALASAELADECEFLLKGLVNDFLLNTRRRIAGVFFEGR